MWKMSGISTSSSTRNRRQQKTNTRTKLYKIIGMSVSVLSMSISPYNLYSVCFYKAIFPFSSFFCSFFLKYCLPTSTIHSFHSIHSRPSTANLAVKNHRMECVFFLWEIKTQRRRPAKADGMFVIVFPAKLFPTNIFVHNCNFVHNIAICKDHVL